MPRKARFFIDEVPVHVVQRGHCREPVFFEEQDYATYMHWVYEAGKRYEVKLHSFCLMTNHVHLLLTPVLAESISLFMQFSVAPPLLLNATRPISPLSISMRTTAVLKASQASLLKLH